MYLALYRKWRPRAFSDVCGQEHITNTLMRQTATNRLSHAYIFVGTRGTGKTTCAKILARAVNCENPVNGDPCNDCDTCRGIENGSILDVLELDAASNNGVDNVRALRDEAIYSPAKAKLRVYIVDEVHMLSLSAFNALLKILEEPPDHLIFILATTEIHKVPATILSRCQRFSFRRLTAETIAMQLTKIADGESLTLHADAADLIAKIADGSMRDAISLLDQCTSRSDIDKNHVLETLGLAGSFDTVNLARMIAKRNCIDAFSLLNKLYQDGKDPGSVLDELTGLMRDCLISALDSNAETLRSGIFTNADIAEITALYSKERLMYALDTLKQSRSNFGLNAKLAAELCLLQLCDERMGTSQTSLLARVARLEQSGVSAVTGSKSMTPLVSESVSVTPASDAVPFGINRALKDAEPPREIKLTPRSKAPKLESADIWSEILKLIEPDIAAHSLLCDPSAVTAEFDGRILTLKAGNPFILKSLESDRIKEIILKSAKTVTTHDVVLHAELKTADRQASADVERLGTFDILKYE